MLPALLLLTISAALADTAAPQFAGRWVGPDPGDGSNLAVTISPGSRSVAMMYTDDNATNACADATSPSFSAVLTGRIDGSELISVFRSARCGSQPLDFRGFVVVWSLDDNGTADLADDILTNQFGEAYTRAN
jgi:hypothetical protein